MGSAHWQASEDPGWGTTEGAFVKLYTEFSPVADLAATAVNRKIPAWLGPGSAYGENALTVDWYAYLCEMSAPAHWPVGFLNPPYSGKLYRQTKDERYSIAAWVKKCALEAEAGCTLVTVLPAAIQTRWWQEYVMESRCCYEVRLQPHRWGFTPSAEAPTIRGGVDRPRHNSAGINHCVCLWRPNIYVGSWTPTIRYWTWRD